MRSNETMRSREAALLTEKRALCGILEQCRSIKTRDAGRTCSKNDRRCAFRCDPSSQRGRNRCPADGQRGWHTCGLLARSLLSRALTFVSLEAPHFAHAYGRAAAAGYVAGAAWYARVPEARQALARRWLACKTPGCYRQTVR